MHKLVVLGLIGLVAQLVDGALGMGYGLTSTTLLLSSGVAAASASASVHLAEIGTTLASAVAHWRFGNVDRGVTVGIAVPGSLGAFAGATVLSGLATAAAIPWTSGLLLALGVYLLVRFARPLREAASRPSPRRLLIPLGLVAGFLDATGGGGWGAVATPTLLTSGRLGVRKAIGSVDTAECAVAVSASAGFAVGTGATVFLAPMVVAMLAGGVLAAPVAAWLVRMVPAQLLGAAVGGLIVITNARTLLQALGVDGDSRWCVYLPALVAWIGAIGLAVRALRQARRPCRQPRVPKGTPCSSHSAAIVMSSACNTCAATSDCSNARGVAGGSEAPAAAIQAVRSSGLSPPWPPSSRWP